MLPSGEFYVTDGYGNARVVHFDAQARYVREWGRRGTAPGKFHTPHVITADERAGNIWDCYWAAHGLEIYGVLKP